MEPDGYYFLGKIYRTFGNAGELLAYFDVDDPSQYVGIQSVWIYVGGNLVPFRVQNINIRNKQQVQLRLEGIESTIKADLLCGCSMYQPIEQLPELGDKQFYFHEIKGFEVCDHLYGTVGKVHGVLDYPMQAILQVDSKGREVLIPVADELIEKVDRVERILYIKAPKGLIELYLGE